MSKWADYGISDVRYNTKHTHIDKVKVLLDNGDTLGSPVEWTREVVIANIKNGLRFITILKNGINNFTKGQPVKIILVNGTEYIKTVDNSKESDNLENLPEF
jgi:hypothetical protein